MSPRPAASERERKASSPALSTIWLERSKLNKSIVHGCEGHPVLLHQILLKSAKKMASQEVSMENTLSVSAGSASSLA